MALTSNPMQVWVHTLCPNSSLSEELVLTCLQQAKITPTPFVPEQLGGVGILITTTITPATGEAVRTLSRYGAERLLVLTAGDHTLDNSDVWSLLQAGASDVLIWDDLADPAAMIVARLHRWREVDELTASPLVCENLVGQSPVWKTVLGQIVEVARYTDAPVLILGETGTGKELAARLIHTLDRQRSQHELVILDCTTLMPDLAGSELFGHERGAFTGAVTARDGAFALAHQGTLFLDEVGELPLTLQVQLLRVLQEQTYKRVGSNRWQQTDFRLIGATNRDLVAEEANGQFRRDLYYRLASWVIRLPPLRERRADILPLARHFMRQAKPEGEPPALDERVQEYLLTRAYPGNVRDLRNLVWRIMARHVPPGPITIGDIPADERPSSGYDAHSWYDSAVDTAIRRALACGVGLKALRRTVEEAAIRIAVDGEDGNLQRAASKLGVTDRALQLRRAEAREQIKAAVHC
jgi:transcriptional regulator with GAF, ATPase, and Fis domain